jgi:hypothetical protein
LLRTAAGVAQVTLLVRAGLDELERKAKAGNQDGCRDRICPLAAEFRLTASEVEAGGGTVDRLDDKTVLGEEQRVPADAATEVEHTRGRMADEPDPMLPRVR